MAGLVEFGKTSEIVICALEDAPVLKAGALLETTVWYGLLRPEFEVETVAGETADPLNAILVLNWPDE